MRLVNPLSVQDLGPISCIVYTRPKSSIIYDQLFFSHASVIDQFIASDF